MSQDMTSMECSMTSMQMTDSGTFSTCSTMSTQPTGATSNNPKGTLFYMAPEQMKAREHLI
jgi:serine/threonine protein kinase